MGANGVGIGGEYNFIGAEFESVFALAQIGGELHDVGTEGVSELESHVAQATQTDDANLFAGANLPMAQR